MNYSHIISNSKTPILYINNIGCSADPENNRFGPGRRNIWLMHYVVSGKGFFNRRPVSAGQGFLIRKGEEEYYYPDKDDPWKFLWITSDDDNIAYYFDKLSDNGKNQIFNFDFTYELNNIITYIENNHNKILECEEIAEVFLHIYNKHKKTVSSKAPVSTKYLDFSVDYINTHIHTDIRVNEIAEILGISNTYLEKQFKNRFDMSPKQYIMNLKLKTAEKMLIGTDLKVTETANSVGFGDVLSFSRFFSGRKGVSPTAFRNNSK